MDEYMQADFGTSHENDLDKEICETVVERGGVATYQFDIIRIQKDEQGGYGIFYQDDLPDRVATFDEAWDIFKRKVAEIGGKE